MTAVTAVKAIQDTSLVILRHTPAHIGMLVKIINWMLLASTKTIFLILQLFSSQPRCKNNLDLYHGDHNLSKSTDRRS